jgi:hypothetical protein
MENTLYYDPTLGRDKVITIEQHFLDGSAIKDSSYIPCQELMYYVRDVYGNGFRELDFSKIGALRLFMGGGSCKSCAYWEGVGEISKDCFSGIVRSAKKRSLDFDLTMEFLWDLFLKQERLCALTKVPLIFCRNRRKFPPPTASLDRIDSNLGYVKENVQWIHKTIQQMKWDYPQNEYINWCKLVSNNAT